MLRYKAVIFDLDGTLLDSVPGIKLTLNMLTKKLGLPELTDEQMQNCIGPPINKFFPEVLHIPEDRLEDALAAYRSLFNEYALEGLALFKGIPALLQALRDKGALLGVATCKVRPSAITQLEKLGGAQYFHEIGGAIPEEGLLEKADILRGTLKKLNVQPGDAIMVGDRKYDMIGAQEAHTRAIGVFYGGCGTREELEAYAPVAIAEDVAHLQKILLEGEIG